VRARLAGVHETYDSTSREYSNGFRPRRNAAQQTDHVSAQFDMPAWYRQLWQFGGDFHRETLDQNVNGTSELAGTGSAERQAGELYLQNDILFNDTWE
jgi:outer membrane receptor for ferrienterochelin and colicins